MTCRSSSPKKQNPRISTGDVYTANVHSYTKGVDYTIRVAQRFLSHGDHVLLIDDFLANGRALLGLIEITRQAGADVAGAGICIEKGFQEGGKIIRAMGVNLQSLAIVNEDEEGHLVFAE